MRTPVARLAVALAAAALAFLVRSAPAHAQAPSLLELSAEYTPPVDLEGGTPTRVQILSYQLALSVPIRLSPSRFLFPGATYHVDQIERSGMTGRARDVLHAPEASMMFIQLLPKRWSITVRGAASIAGRTDTIDDRMISYGAMALVGWAASDRLALGAGMLVTGGFGQVLPLPALSVRWRPRADFALDVFIPAFAAVRYTAWNRVELGVRAEISGHTYAYRGDVPRACGSTSGPERGDTMDSCIDHVRYTVGSVGLTAGLRLGSTVWLTAFAGTTVYRSSEQLDRDDDQLAGTSHAMPRVMFVRTNLAWRLPGS